MRTITEYISIGKAGVRVIDKAEATSNKKDNIYFLDGVRSDLDYSNGQRAKDKDIILKDMFVIDLDMRNNADYPIENEDIITEGTNIAHNLEKDSDLYGEWSKIVFTGNGLHIYYSGIPTTFKVEEYAMGVEKIYRDWDNWWGAKEYNSDHACKNLARILRLPGSINQKNGTEVFVIAEREKQSKLFNNIKTYATTELKKIKQQEEKSKAEREALLKSFKPGENDNYLKINAIPAYEVVQILIPEFPFNGKKNFKNKKGGFTAYYYKADENIIFNGGSRYFTEQKGFNNFQLVKFFKNWTNAETFSYFKKLLGLK